MGSPNIKGNTAKLVDAILDGAAENGANKVVYNLASLEIKGCDACRRCQDSGCCLIDSTSLTGSENHLSPLRFQTFNRKVF